MAAVISAVALTGTIAAVGVVGAATAYSIYNSYEQAQEAKKQQKEQNKIGALYGENADYAKQLERRRQTLLQPTVSAGLALGENMNKGTDISRQQGELNTAINPRLGLAGQVEKQQISRSGAGVGGARDITSMRSLTDMSSGMKSAQSVGLANASRLDDQNRKIASIKAGQQLSTL